MDFLKKLGLVEDNAKPVEETEEAVEVAPRPSLTKPRRPVFSTGTPPATPNTAPVASQSGIAPDPALLETLNQTANGSTKRGYKEFTAIFNTLPQSLPLAQRYATALALVEQTSNGQVKSADVLVSLDDRIALVEGDRDGYEEAYAGSLQQSVTDRKENAEQINAEIQSKKEEIKALEAQKLELLSQAEQAELDLHREKATFNVSCEVVLSSLRSERDQIASYIPTTK